MMIQVNGEGGESIVFDGVTVSKYLHDGKEQAATNLATTYRETRVTPKKAKAGEEQRYDVLIACGTIFSLTVPESETSKLAELVAELERLTAGS